MNNWKDEFDKEFPPFRGVGAQFPIFVRTPNRYYIMKFMERQFEKLIKEIPETLTFTHTDGPLNHRTAYTMPTDNLKQQLRSRWLGKE